VPVLQAGSLEFKCGPVPAKKKKKKKAQNSKIRHVKVIYKLSD
jgi:hypothetical protein